jgi:hypothetical protein
LLELRADGAVMPLIRESAFGVIEMHGSQDYEVSRFTGRKEGASGFTSNVHVMMGFKMSL